MPAGRHRRQPRPLQRHCRRSARCVKRLSRGAEGTWHLRLADSSRATVKLSGFSKFSSAEFPFADTHIYTGALLDAFGPDHCLWASDWPFLKAPQRLDYGPLLQLFAQQVPDAEDRQKILWHTPRRLFGFQ